MNKIKKAICLLASITMCLSLFGCNSDDDSKSDKRSKAEVTAESTEKITQRQKEYELNETAKIGELSFSVSDKWEYLEIEELGAHNWSAEDNSTLYIRYEENTRSSGNYGKSYVEAFEESLGEEVIEYETIKLFGIENVLKMQYMLNGILTYSYTFVYNGDSYSISCHINLKDGQPSEMSLYFPDVIKSVMLSESGEALNELELSEYTESPYNIYSYFRETCKDIGQYIEYTEETDANKVLGTDGSYMAKLNFSLTSLEENTVIYPDLGATIEIYKNSIDAENMKKEYDNYSAEELGYDVFISENVILRTTIEADRDTVKSLQDNLIVFMKKPKNYTEQQETMKNEEVHPFSIPENYKAKCQDMSYSEIARDTNGLRGQYCKFTGQITQVMDDIYLMNVTADEYGFYSDSIMFTYNIGNENRILQDDIVTIWGQSLGLVTYTSVLGADITVPEIEAKYITIENLD